MISKKEKCKAIADYFKSIIPEWGRNVDSCFTCKRLAKEVMFIDANMTYTATECNRAGDVMIAVIDHFNKEHKT